MDFYVKNTNATIELGKKLGSLAKAGDIFCINGELGTGKTHFTKGIALGLEIDEHITSPTFTIVNEYEGRLRLNHFDVYRVNDPDEIYAIGFDEYIFSNAVSVIEWSKYIDVLIPKDHVEITIEKQEALGENNRKISIEYLGERYKHLEGLNL